MSPSLKIAPVSCALITLTDTIELEIINYHYRGASFRVQPGDYRVQTKGNYLQFRIGDQPLNEQIHYRLAWENIEADGSFGVAFAAESERVLRRQTERFNSHFANAPVVSCADPLDPHRLLFLKAVNISSTGLLLATSFTNKHLFPGMELRQARIDISTIGRVVVDLFIENARKDEAETSVLYGVSVKGQTAEYAALVAKYVLALGQSDGAVIENQSPVEAPKLKQKKVSQHLTIREVTTEQAYEEVLKLRFMGYSKVGKTKDKTTWRDMGDGLVNEGMVLGAYLSSQLVGAAELRLQRTHGLRLAKTLNLGALSGLRGDNHFEINKLVVHPKAQNSDVVVGLFQKIHGIVMINGRPDGLIVAEEKLVSLYHRLGFNKIGYSFPHPVKDNVTLNVMQLKNEAYADAQGMNPYAWSVVYEKSHDFLAAIGAQHRVTFSPRQRAIKLTSALAHQAFLRFKKQARRAKPMDRDVQERDRSTREPAAQVPLRQVTDPRYTLPHINATVLLTYMMEAEAMIGREKLTAILITFGFEVSYFSSVANWVSVEFFDEFIARFSESDDPYALNRNAGYRMASKEVLGSNYYIVKHFFSPDIAFRALEKYMPKFNKVRALKVLAAGPSHCRVRISNLDPRLLPKHPSTNENWLAIFDAYVKIITKYPARIDVIKSSFAGDSYCEYLIRWKNPLFSFRRIAPYGLAGVCLFSAAQSVYESRGLSQTLLFAAAAFATGLFLWAARKWKLYKGRYQEMLDAMTAFEKETDRRYQELQTSKGILEKNYQEGKMLEVIHRQIQTSVDVTHILNKALEAIDQTFQIDRSFVMICDDSEAMLRTAALRGDDPALQEIWKFKVDVSSYRENPLVLSSVYHTGHSIMIGNTDDHKFQFNASSQALIDHLGSRSFAMVPVPSQHRNWGVLIADKGKDGEVITRRDLTALQRVAQSIGLALDKKAILDSETRARKIFQKFVPPHVVESTLGTSEPTLGGEKKEAVCMFMDIRDFTRMADSLHPQILCEFLNQIFNLLHEKVSAKGGVIDKFLGDGALITWGAVPGSELKPELALEAALSFCDQLDEFNLSLERQQLPPIEVGFGIHQGEVVAGNIGAAARMEFTVIGSTVNVASRLEQLNKTHGSQIVISETVMNLDELHEGWERIEGIAVRGLERGLNIAVYRRHASTASKQEKRVA